MNNSSFDDDHHSVHEEILSDRFDTNVHHKNGSHQNGSHQNGNNHHQNNHNGGQVTTIERTSTPTKSVTIAPFPHSIDHQISLTTPADFLPPIGRWVTVGGLIMLTSLVTAITVSTFLKYKITVQAPATIRPVGELRLVQSTIEGSIEQISVQENKLVNKGDPIATVRDLRLESKLETKRSQLVGDNQKTKQQINTINAQISAGDAQIRASNAQLRANDAQISARHRQGLAERDRSNQSIAIIKTEFSRAQRDHHDKQITAQSEVAEAEANLRIAQKEQQVAEADLNITAANLKSIQAGYQSALVRSQRYQSVATVGAISTNQLEEAKLSAEQQAQAIAVQEATMLKQKQIVARLAQSVIAASTRIQRTQTTLNPSQSASAALTQKIVGEQANARAAIEILQQERQKLFQDGQRISQDGQRLIQERQRLIQQRSEIFSQVAANNREIAQIATDLKPTQILAPVSGTIQELSLRNNAQVVHPGDRIAQIIPTGTPLNVKAYVAISDIDKVKVGQKVQMRVSACPYTDYGVGSGSVKAISADAKSMQRNGASALLQTQAANDIYEVTIAPDHLNLSRGSSKCQIRSGMDGRVDIISKEETVFQFILKKARLWDI
jgi:multidrug efflux pump subunit AcrA (membrane-fusion protein)